MRGVDGVQAPSTSVGIYRIESFDTSKIWNDSVYQIVIEQRFALHALTPP